MRWIYLLLLLTALVANAQDGAKTWDEAMAEGRRCVAGPMHVAVQNFERAVQLSADFDRDDPRIEEGSFALAAVFYTFGRPDEGDRVIRELVVRLLDADGQPTDRLLGGWLAEANALKAKNKYDEAGARYAGCLCAREVAYGKESPQLLEVLLPYADACSRKGRHAYAIPLLRRVVNIMAKQSRANNPGLLEPLVTLGFSAFLAGDFPQAMAVYQWTRALQEEILSPNEPAHYTILVCLYLNYEGWGKYTECLSLLPEMERRLAALRWTLPSADYNALLSGWGDQELRWAESYARLGYYQEAERRYARMQAELRNPETQGARMAEYAGTRMRLLMRAGRYVEAQAVGMELAALQEGARAPMVRRGLPMTLLLLADCHRALGDAEAAAAMTAQTTALFPEVMKSGYTSEMMIAYLRLSNKLDEALDRANANIEARLRGRSDTHPLVADARCDKAELLMAMNNPADAEPLLRQALATWEQVAGPDHRAVLPRLRPLAACLVAEGKFKDADELYARALRIAEEAYGKDDPLTGEVLGEYAACVRKQGRGAEADALEARAREIRAKGLPTEAVE